MDERRHGSLSPSCVSLQSLGEAGARQLQKQTSRSLLAAETRTVAASSSARVRLALQIYEGDCTVKFSCRSAVLVITLVWGSVYSVVSEYGETGAAAPNHCFDPKSNLEDAGMELRLGGRCNAGEQVPIRSDRRGIQGSKDVRPAGQACGLRQLRFLQRDSGQDSPA